MKKILLSGLLLSSLLLGSSQSVEHVHNLQISLQFINPLDVIEQQNNVLDSLASDSVAITVRFSVADTLNLQGITCRLMQDSQNLINEFYFDFSAYAFDYESSLFRDQNYLMSTLGVHNYSPQMLVKVKLHYTEFDTEFYSKSVNN